MYIYHITLYYIILYCIILYIYIYLSISYTLPNFMFDTLSLSINTWCNGKFRINKGLRSYHMFGPCRVAPINRFLAIDPAIGVPGMAMETPYLYPFISHNPELSTHNSIYNH